MLPAANCIFNDVTAGTIAVNCTGTNCFGASGTNQGVLSTSTTALDPAYNAGTGWDFATGLGTINAYNLVQAAGGCVVGGTFYPTGAKNPANACQTCQPGTSATTFTNVTNGTSCGAGEVCNGTACSSGCFIGGTFYASGAVNPADACQTCQPATSTTVFTNSPNGVNASCPAGDVCRQRRLHAGVLHRRGTYYASGAGESRQRLPDVPARSQHDGVLERHQRHDLQRR